MNPPLPAYKNTYNPGLVHRLKRSGCRFGQHVEKTLLECPRSVDPIGPRELFRTECITDRITHKTICEKALSVGLQYLTPFALEPIIVDLLNNQTTHDLKIFLGMRPVMTSFGVPMIFVLFQSQTNITIIVRNALDHEQHSPHEIWLFAR